MVKIEQNHHKQGRNVLVNGELVATIAHTDNCATYGGKCWHLLHLNGRCDHHETYSACRDDALKISVKVNV